MIHKIPDDLVYSNNDVIINILTMLDIKELYKATGNREEIIEYSINKNIKHIKHCFSENKYTKLALPTTNEKEYFLSLFGCTESRGIVGHTYTPPFFLSYEIIRPNYEFSKNHKIITDYVDLLTFCSAI